MEPTDEAASAAADLGISAAISEEARDRDSLMRWQALCILGLSIIFFEQLRARQSPDSRTRENRGRFLRSPSTIDPDMPVFQFSRVGGRWINKVGASINIADITLFGAHTNFTIEPFIEIHDFNPGNDFSWELWRGSFGLNMQSRFETDIMRFSHQPAEFRAEIGYFHESEHASSINYTRRFTNYLSFESFPNGNFGSFEYIRIRSGAIHADENQWTIAWHLFAKYFPKPIEKGAGRQLRNSYGTDISIHRVLSDVVSAYVAGYYEVIQTGFTAARANFQPDFDSGKLMYRTIEGGVDFSLSKFRLIPYLIYTSSHGRGLDFLKTYKEFGYGLRILL